MISLAKWRRGRDSNPRYGCPYAAFRVRCFQPLSHLSVQADQLLKLAKDSKPRPGVVHYEHQHLSPEDRDAAEALLHSHGYTLHRSQFDTLAVLDQATRDVPRRMKPLRTLALSLEADPDESDAVPPNAVLLVLNCTVPAGMTPPPLTPAENVNPAR